MDLYREVFLYAHSLFSLSLCAQGNGICGLLILIAHRICGQRKEENRITDEREVDKKGKVLSVSVQAWLRRYKEMNTNHF